MELLLWLLRGFNNGAYMGHAWGLIGASMRLVKDFLFGRCVGFICGRFGAQGFQVLEEGCRGQDLRVDSPRFEKNS